MSDSARWTIGQTPWLGAGSMAEPRARVIVDNDFAGDPDDLCQLVHQLLSPSVEVRGIVASHLAPGDPFHPGPGSTAAAAARVHELCAVLGLDPGDRVWLGAEEGLADPSTPRESEAARRIVAYLYGSIAQVRRQMRAAGLGVGELFRKVELFAAWRRSA